MKTNNPFGALGQLPNNFGSSLALIANGLGMMGGAPSNTGLVSAGRAMDRDAQERAGQQRFSQLMRDPNVVGSLPKNIQAILPFMAPQAAGDIVAQYQARTARDARETADAEEGRRRYNQDYGLRRDKFDASRQRANGPGRYGKQLYGYRGPDGNHYVVQGANDGTIKQHTLNGLTRDRGVAEVDTGTGTRLVDRTTGKDVREINKNIEEEERRKIVGRNKGNVEVNKPKATAALNLMKTKNKVMIGTIDRALDTLDWNATGLVGWATSVVPDTEAFKLKNFLETIKANIGFDALQAMREASPRGGALGQVAVQELMALQATLGSLDQAQSPQEIRRVLQNVKSIVAFNTKRRREAYRETYGDLPASLSDPVQRGESEASQSNSPADDGFKILGKSN